MQLLDPGVSDFAADQTRELRIARHDESARGNAVGDVEKSVRPKFKEVVQGGLLKKLGMQFGHSIDGVAADSGEISHPDVPFTAFIDQRHPGNPRRVIGILKADFVQEATVDLEDNLQMPG